MAEKKVTRRAKPRRGGPIRVYGQRRDEVDMNKLARVLIALTRQEGNDPENIKRDETP